MAALRATHDETHEVAFVNGKSILPSGLFVTLRALKDRLFVCGHC